MTIQMPQSSWGSCRGYLTSIAFDGPSAIAAASSFQPELTILDIGLPVMDGYELATQLRSLLVHRTRG